MVYLKTYRKRNVIERFALCAERLRDLALEREHQAVLELEEQRFCQLIGDRFGTFSIGCLVIAELNPLHPLTVLETMLADQQEEVGEQGYHPRNAAHRESLLRRWDSRFPRLRTKRSWREDMIEILLPL